MLFKKKKAKVKSIKRRKISKKRKANKRKNAFGGYKIIPDEKLGAIVGNKPLTPAEMTKAIWKYIKKNKLSNR
ncbi:MAG: hypothetical protein J7K26_02535 [Candidatus Aenigmarchaeota archaeon]|nr:hypothetical protein [Candidatus Aenigmarchaeota archaeon]